MKKIFELLLFCLLFLAIIININFSGKMDVTNNLKGIEYLQKIALADSEGTPSCYDSHEYYCCANPGSGFEVIWGERCYENGVECGQNNGCDQRSGATNNSCDELTC